MIDQAQALEQAQLDRALAGRRRPGAADLTPRDCLGCGEPIPAPRLALVPGAMRCTPCQRRYEATHAQP
ncbi:MAG: TraR/DksA C4-type zinc finger protein [Azospirillaceae bacterium]|nr:TraR/DksA C4-type zinc finger protein [Azospirillaceae bacterium]